jgi:hypothetical protein
LTEDPIRLSSQFDESEGGKHTSRPRLTLQDSVQRMIRDSDEVAERSIARWCVVQWGGRPGGGGAPRGALWEGCGSPRGAFWERWRGPAVVRGEIGGARDYCPMRRKGRSG